MQRRRFLLQITRTDLEIMWILQTAGVECFVENNSVGANFQDHIFDELFVLSKREYRWTFYTENNP